MSEIGIFEAADCYVISSVAAGDETIKQNVSAEWAKRNGVDIQRYSLAKNPQQFLNTPVIREFLSTSRAESPPVTLFDGELVMTDKLPAREDIVCWVGIPFTQDWSGDGAQPYCCSIPRIP